MVIAVASRRTHFPFVTSDCFPSIRRPSALLWTVAGLRVDRNH